MTPKLCPLCTLPLPAPHLSLNGRRAARCRQCDLISVHEPDWLTPEQEHERYLLHRNSRENADYIAFLNTVVTAVAEHVTPPAAILDFGSGPEPVLAELLRARGYDVALFDPLFAPHESVLGEQYDAVVCCETAEHFRTPASEWQTMCDATRRDGFLIVKTLFHDDSTDIENWWYVRDPTHVCFYSERTLAWIANRFGLRLVSTDARHGILKKQTGLK